MGIAKIYNQKQSGLDIDGLVQDYYVYAGENISAGNFVEFVNGIAGQTSLTTIPIATNINTSPCKFCILSDTKLIYIYYSGNYVYAKVGILTDNTITWGSTYTITEELAFGNSSGLLFVENIATDKVAVIYKSYPASTSRYTYSIKALNISGTIITYGDAVDIAKSRQTSNLLYGDLKKMTDNYLLFCYDDPDCEALIISFSGLVPTLGTSLCVIDGDCRMTYATKISTTKAVTICTDADTNYKACSNVLTRNGTTLTASSIYTYNTGITYSLDICTVNSNTIVIAMYDYANSRTGAVIAGTVSSSTITYGTKYTFTGYQYDSGWLGSGGNNIAILHAETYQHTIAVSGTTLSVGERISVDTSIHGEIKFFNTDTFWTSYVAYGQKFSIKDGKVSNIVLTTIYETQVRKATTPDIYGVSKTEGTGGTSSGHKDMISIYRPYFINDSMNLATNSISDWGYSTSYVNISNVDYNGRKNVIKIGVNALGTSSNLYMLAYSTAIQTANHIYYTRFETCEPTTNTGNFNVNIGLSVKKNNLQADNTWHVLSTRGTPGSSNQRSVDLRSNANMSLTDVYYFNWICSYDLTSLFGAGNEPTKEWCDEHL